MKQIQLIGLTVDENNAPIFEYFDRKFKQLQEQFQPREPETYLTRKQVAEMLQVNYTTLHNWKHKNILVPVGIGSRVLYKRSDIENKLIKLG